MGMLICVLDDSGSNKEGPVFVLAGYAAPVSSWEGFSRRWQELLNKEPKLAYFKMKEAHGLRGEFKGWRVEDRDARVMEFADVIKQTERAIGITSAIFWEDFRQVCAEFPDVPLHPYDMLFHGSMAVLHGYCRRNGVKEKIDFVLDEQGKWAERAVRAYESSLPIFTDEEKQLMGKLPIHSSDKEFLPLQAADLIAWQTRRFCEENKEPDPLAPIEAFTVNSTALRQLEKIETLYNTSGVERLRNVARDWQSAKRLLGTDPTRDALRNWHSQTPDYMK